MASDYEVAVEGHAEGGDTDDTVNCSGGVCTIDGAVAGGTDEYEVAGHIPNVNYSGDDLMVTVNGYGPYPAEELEGLGNFPLGLEDFAHADVEGHYIGETQHFGISSDERGYYLEPTGKGDHGPMIVMDDQMVIEGNTYTAKFTVDGPSDFAIPFAGNDTWYNEYSGYIALFGPDVTRLGRFDNFDQVESIEGPAIPQGEVVTAEIDFRDTSDSIILTVYDSSGSEVLSLTLDDDQYESGSVGVYHWEHEPYKLYEIREGVGSIFDPDAVDIDSCNLLDENIEVGEYADAEVFVVNGNESAAEVELVVNVGPEESRSTMTVTGNSTATELVSIGIDEEGEYDVTMDIDSVTEL